MLSLQLKQVREFGTLSSVADDDLLLIQTAGGVTQNTTKGVLLNDVLSISGGDITGDLVITGDLTVQGDEIINGTNAAPGNTFTAKDGNGTPILSVSNATLGGLTGAIIGYAKAWRDMIKTLMPNKMLEIGRNAMNSVRNFFAMVGERFGNFMKRVGDLFKNDGPVGRVAGFFADIGTKIADFFKPITEAIGRMKGTGEGLSKVFKPITA